MQRAGGSRLGVVNSLVGDKVVSEKVKKLNRSCLHGKTAGPHAH